MDVTVSSRHVELSNALRSAAVEKVGRLSRFLDGMDHAEVHFYEERNPRIVDKDVCEVTIDGRGHHVRAKVAAPDAFAAVDAAVAKLEHQLHKLKTKLVGRSHPRRREEPLPVGLDDGDGDGTTLADLAADDATAGRATDGAALDGAGTAGARIVKNKTFVMRPMAPPEAASEMELLGHSFYFFANAETGRAAVVYRRGDGDVGLIDEAGATAEPEAVTAGSPGPGEGGEGHR